MAAGDPLSTGFSSRRTVRGRRHPVSHVKRAWCVALRRAKIENFRFHDLSHTFASHFAMNGGNIYALAKILGHANPKMTLDRYAHLSQEFINEQRAVMDRTVYAPTVNRSSGSESTSNQHP